MEDQRNVVVFTGLPGTGKSALAHRVAALVTPKPSTYSRPPYRTATATPGMA